MRDTDKYFFTVSDLIEALKEFPGDMPVLVSGYNSGFDNFYSPFVYKVVHCPENFYSDGLFQDSKDGEPVLVLKRVFRDD